MLFGVLCVVTICLLTSLEILGTAQIVGIVANVNKRSARMFRNLCHLAESVEPAAEAAALCIPADWF